MKTPIKCSTLILPSPHSLSIHGFYYIESEYANIIGKQMKKISNIFLLHSNNSEIDFKGGENSYQ